MRTRKTAWPNNQKRQPCTSSTRTHASTARGALLISSQSAVNIEHSISADHCEVRGSAVRPASTRSDEYGFGKETRATLAISNISYGGASSGVKAQTQHATHNTQRRSRQKMRAARRNNILLRPGPATDKELVRAKRKQRVALQMTGSGSADCRRAHATEDSPTACASALVTVEQKKRTRVRV